jgi:hypothetical protein
MNTALVSAKMIADDICEDIIGDTTYKHHRFLMKQIVDCYSELNIYHVPGFVVSTKEFPYNQVLNFPECCVYITKIGIKVKGEKLILLDKNYDNDIIPSVNGKEVLEYIDKCYHYDETERFVPFYDSMGNLVYKAYGTGARCKSMYVVDKDARKIYLGSNWPRDCQVVIEFKDSGYTTNNLFPIEFKSTLMNYALWKYYLKKRDSMFQTYERYYKASRFKLVDLLTFQPIDYLASLFSQDRGTIKDYFNA